MNTSEKALIYRAREDIIVVNPAAGNGGDGMPLSDAQRRAKRKYDAKTYTELRIKPTNSEAERIKAHAEGRGESLTRFLVRSAENQIWIDNERKDELLRGMEDEELLQELDELLEKE